MTPMLRVTFGAMSAAPWPMALSTEARAASRERAMLSELVDSIRVTDTTQLVHGVYQIGDV